MNDLLSVVHAYRGIKIRASSLLPRQRLRRVLGMLSSLEVKVLRPT
jgi:hypothetical protein